VTTLIGDMIEMKIRHAPAVMVEADRYHGRIIDPAAGILDDSANSDKTLMSCGF